MLDSGKDAILRTAFSTADQLTYLFIIMFHIWSTPTMCICLLMKQLGEQVATCAVRFPMCFDVSPFQIGCSAGVYLT